MRELVRELEQLEQSRHRNQRLQSLGSSWHHANIGQRCSSRPHLPRCASCEFLVRQPLMQKLQQPDMRRFCLV